MAFPLSHSLSPSSSSSSIPQALIFPIPQHRADLKIHAHLSTRSLQPSSNGESSEPEPESTTDLTNIKRRKKKKLRPSFYNQTLERWSVRISSQRSKFPWQEQAEVEERRRKKKDEASLLAGLASSDHVLDNFRDTHLSSSVNFENPARTFDVDDGPLRAKRENATWVPLGNQRGFAPWVHGVKSKPGEGLKIGGEEEEKGDDDLRDDESKYILNASELNVDEGRLKLEYSAQSDKSYVNLIVDELKNSLDQSVNISTDEVENVVASNSARDIVKLTGPVRLPWERGNSGGDTERLPWERDNGSVDRERMPWERSDDGSNGELLRKRSNTELAEKTIPEDELRRLRNVALRMKERIKVGAAGVTEALVESIHKKWKVDEVVKLWFEGPPTLHMKRTHETLEVSLALTKQEL